MRALSLFILLMLMASVTWAQECTPGGEDGPIATKHSAVKKPGDPVTVSWVNPQFDESCDPLEGDTALTAIELYMSVDAPVPEGFAPIATYGPGDSTGVTVSADANKGQVIYYMLRACNDFGCSKMSNQEFVKLPGNPKGPGASAR